MKEKIQIVKDVYGRNTYGNVVNRNFNQLVVNNSNTGSLEQQTTVEEFFQLYDDLFYQIPKEGDINSHQFLVNKSSEYLGIKNQDDFDVQLLLDEITTLRQRLLESSEIIESLKMVNSSNL